MAGPGRSRWGTARGHPFNAAVPSVGRRLLTGNVAVITIRPHRQRSASGPPALTSRSTTRFVAETVVPATPHDYQPPARQPSRGVAGPGGSAEVRRSARGRYDLARA